MVLVLFLLLIEQSTSVVNIEVDEDCSSYIQRIAHLEQRMEQMERTPSSTKVIAQVRLPGDLNAASISTVLYNRNVSNIGGAFDMEYREFTAPVDGTYYVFLQACVASNAWMTLAIMKDGALIGKLLCGATDYHIAAPRILW